MHSNDLIILFTKYPVPGKVKTRLIEAIGPDEAARVHREMAVFVLERMKSAAQACGADLEVWYDGGDAEAMAGFLGAGMRYVHQGTGDLGERMARAFEVSLAKRKRVLIVGSDCPTVGTDTIAAAFEGLTGHDITLGPATDGGYYLIGQRRPVRGVFEGIAWSTDSVFESTLGIIEKIGAAVSLLEEMSDVDEPRDLKIWEDIQKSLLGNPRDTP